MSVPWLVGWSVSQANLITKSTKLLVACTRLYNPLCPSVGWSHFTFFYDFITLTSLLLPKWSGDLKYGPFPPARNFDSRVLDLVFIQNVGLLTL